MEILWLLVGLIAGIIIGLILFKFLFEKKGNSNAIDAEALRNEANQFREKLAMLSGEEKALKEQNQQLSTQLQAARSKNEELLADLATSKQETLNLREKIESSQGELAKAREELRKDFELLAQRIFDEKSVKFTEQNSQKLGALLTPFQNKIKEFENKVESTYEKGLKERSALAERIQQLTQLNEQMRTDAKNLTNALKGDNKTQGNWGEMILERILEQSGLEKDEEYKTQVTDRHDEGNLIKPDVVVYLPENKHIIIDAKVSLVAYENYINADDEDDQQNFLKQHLISLKTHIKQLNEKNYTGTSHLNTPDFVMLFMPIEPAFSAAFKADKDIFNYAWEKRIVLVSPSTLLASLKTVSAIWKQEKHNKNAQEIARQAGKMYDKFVSFLEDMNKVEKSFEVTFKHFDSAKKKLHTGKDNLVRKATKLKELGVSSSKDLPEDFEENQLEA